MTQAVAIAQSGTNNVTMRNRIINGAMMIDQRGTAASPVTIPNGSSAYSVDQWRTYKDPSTGVFTAQQSSTAPAGFTKSLLLTASTGFSTTAAQYVTTVNSIEGNNIQDLGFGAVGAQTITISFWVRSNLTGTYGFSIGNSANDRSYVATYTINAANTWEQKTITVAGDTSGTWATDTSAGLRVRFDLGCGSNFNTTAGAWTAGIYTRTSGCVNWSATTGNTFYITGVQLEAGTAATPFENRLYGTELMLCQRYYEVTATNGANGSFIMNGYVSASGQILRVSITWAVPKRALPTVSIVGTWGVSGLGQPSVAGYSETGARLDATSTTSGIVYAYSGTSGNCITSSAEL